jgi:hypothetical protein
MAVQYGAIQGMASSIDVVITGSTSAYSAGDVVGGVLTFSNALNGLGQAVIQSLTLRSKSVQTAGFKLYVFSANPSNTTWTDNAAPSLNAADLPSLLGVYSLTTADSGLGTMTIYNLDGIGKTVEVNDLSVNTPARDLYGVIVTTGTPTLTTATDLTVNFSTLW